MVYNGLWKLQFWAYWVFLSTTEVVVDLLEYEPKYISKHLLDDYVDCKLAGIVSFMELIAFLIQSLCLLIY